jgi:hypothetical protein
MLTMCCRTDYDFSIDPTSQVSRLATVSAIIYLLFEFMNTDPVFSVCGP